MTNSLNFIQGAGLALLIAAPSTEVMAQNNTCTWFSPAERMIVAELYTSQGCSSCPPADRWLTDQLSTPERSDSVLALSFHVDYWNYLGWKDPYSKKQFTERQYAHKHAGNIGQIYTPQYVFSNREVRRWGQAGLMPQQLAAKKHDKAPVNIEVSLERKAGNQVEIKVETNWLDERYKTGQMYLALYEDNLSQQVKSGENRGELLRHNRVVRHLSQAMVVTPGKSVQVFRHTIPADWNQSNVGIGVIVENSESNIVLQALNAPGALSLCS